MAFQFTSAGLSIQTYAEVLEDVQSDFRSRFTSRIATAANSFAGQLQRIIALYHYREQEQTQRGYQALDIRLAEGVHLDNRVQGLGLTREAAARAEVLGTITTSGTVSIPDGTRFEVGGFTFATIDGPYSRTGAGTITSVRLQSELYQAIDASTLGAWTITDAISDMDSFAETSQPIAGQVQEADAALRARAEIERFARAGDPLEAINAGVQLATGVTYARAYHNVDQSTDPDANGIPYGAINVVAQGGTDADVAAAIEAYAPAATVLYGTTEVTVGSGALERIVGFDRVSEVDMYIRVTVTTSTSEELSDALETAALEETIESTLETWTTANWSIGKDVIPAELVGALMAAGIPAVDALVVEVSDDGVSWSTSKYALTIRQQAIYADARVTVVEN